MAFVTKVWKDRLVEFAGRRKLKDVKTGVETTVDVSRMEGAVSLAGDAFSAANMNNLEQRIKTEFDSVNQSLNGNILLTEGSGANTKYYIQKGADTASKKLLGSFKITSLGSIRFDNRDLTSATVSATGIPNYKELTSNNFIIQYDSHAGQSSGSHYMQAYVDKSYNPSTGIISLSQRINWLNANQCAVITFVSVICVYAG